MRRSKGKMSKKTKKLKSGGRFTVSRLTKSFSIGDKVALDTQPYFLGMSSLRYKGATGKIVSKQGSSYVVEIKDGNMRKNLILHPIHLKQL